MLGCFRRSATCKLAMSGFSWCLISNRVCCSRITLALTLTRIASIQMHPWPGNLLSLIIVCEMEATYYVPCPKRFYQNPNRITEGFQARLKRHGVSKVEVVKTTATLMPGLFLPGNSFNFPATPQQQITKLNMLVQRIQLHNSRRKMMLSKFTSFPSPWSPLHASLKCRSRYPA